MKSHNTYAILLPADCVNENKKTRMVGRQRFANVLQRKRFPICFKCSWIIKLIAVSKPTTFLFVKGSGHEFDHMVISNATAAAEVWQLAPFTREYRCKCATSDTPAGFADDDDGWRTRLVSTTKTTLCRAFEVHGTLSTQMMKKRCRVPFFALKFAVVQVAHERLWRIKNRIIPQA